MARSSSRGSARLRGATALGFGSLADFSGRAARNALRSRRSAVTGRYVNRVAGRIAASSSSTSELSGAWRDVGDSLRAAMTEVGSEQEMKTSGESEPTRSRGAVAG